MTMRLKNVPLAVGTILVSLLFPFSVLPATSEITYPAKAPKYQAFETWYQTQHKPKKGQKKTPLPFVAAAVLDANTGTPLYLSNATTQLPTASLMKLITAGAILTYQSDWYRSAYFTHEENGSLLSVYVEPNDRFSHLTLAEGDTITLEQAFASMLIGSANNAAVAMPRLVGTTREQFIARMREQATTWGLSNTIVDEPSGLSLQNLSTAEDMAKAACAAFKNFMISFYSRSPKVNFTTQNGISKTVAHTVHDLRLHPERYLGAKTGYLTETKFHQATELVSPKGHKLCLAVLTTDSRAIAETTSWELAQWVDKMYSWVGQ